MPLNIISLSASDFLTKRISTDVAIEVTMANGPRQRDGHNCGPLCLAVSINDGMLICLFGDFFFTISVSI